MTSASKRKGDLGERMALALCRMLGFPWTERTRAGYERDHGDLHLCPGPAVIAQVKNVRTPDWSEWLTQLSDQVAHSGADHGFVLWKRPGIGFDRSDAWLAVMAPAQLAVLLRQAGYGAELETGQPAAVEDVA